MHRLIVGFLLYLYLGMVSAFAQQAMHIPVDATPLVIETADGKAVYDVEIAFQPEQTAAGLMYRTDFPRDRAMLFKFSDQRIVTMWMANTPLSLDMVFIDDTGVIVSVAENTTPFSTKIVSSRMPASFTIELNSGEVAQKHIAPGQRVIHPAICGACKVDQK
ncbi:DUF192 domain-containing protein [Bartonella sp. LJL80]